jgi:flotillin
MNGEGLFLVLFLIIAYLLFTVGLAIGFARFYRRAGANEALVRTGKGGLKAITGSGLWVVPILHQYERMDLSVKRIPVACKGPAALVCRDDVRADLEVDFLVRVNNTPEDIKTVAQTIGCAQASDPRVLDDLFHARFAEAMAAVCGQFDFADIYADRERFKENILQAVAPDMQGYVLEGCAIKSLARTPGEQLVQS